MKCGKMKCGKTLLFTAVVALVAAFSITATAVAGKPKPVHSNLRCFADGVATCVLDSATSARLDVPAGSDAGVYRTDKAAHVSGSPLGPVKFSFDYVCDSAANCVAGGSPSWAIPIDSNGNKTTDAYAFVDANNCGQAGFAAGTVDDNCQVAYAPDGVSLYANWAAFAAAHPSYKIANAITFVIAEQPFNGTISNVALSK